MRPGERASIENGIWLCQTHGKLIDTDETRFSIEMLKTWRRLAERRAQLEQALGRQVDLSASHVTDLVLADNVVSLSRRGKENRIIGQALRDSCLSVVWGTNVAAAVRDALVEIARNAFAHGGASRCELRVEPRAVRLTEDGGYFVPWRMLTGERGGATAIRNLLDAHGERLIVESRRVGEATNHVVAFVTPGFDLGAITPCVVQFSVDDDDNFVASLDILESCEMVYAVVPDFQSYSELEEMMDALARLLSASPGRTVAFVTHDVSAGVLRALSIMAEERFRGCRLVRI